MSAEALTDTTKIVVETDEQDPKIIASHHGRGY